MTGGGESPLPVKTLLPQGLKASWPVAVTEKSRTRSSVAVSLLMAGGSSGAAGPGTQFGSDGGAEGVESDQENYSGREGRRLVAPVGPSSRTARPALAGRLKSPCSLCPSGRRINRNGGGVTRCRGGEVLRS